MAETKYVMDALSRLSQDATIDLASRSEAGKWAIEHRTTMVITMRNVITELLNRSDLRNANELR